MSRPITIGNGNLLVGLDSRAQVKDFYFPYAGHSNHVSGASGSYVHRVGIWVDGVLRWLSDPSWEIDIRYSDLFGTSNIYAKNVDIGVSLHVIDGVHNEKNVFVRKITITNERNNAREIKIFFDQEFRISESRRGDTAYYDPRVRAIVHYKGHNAFLIYAMLAGSGFSDYSVGLFDIEGKKGSFTDAEDGVLSRNPIEHGSVDSIIGLTSTIEANESIDAHYWVAAGKTIQETHILHAYVLEETPETLLESTDRYWNAWTEKEARSFGSLSPRIESLYKRSLAVIRVHADNRGGIIASSDSDMLNQGRDTYAYVWPRDGAINASALDRAGHVDVTQRFFAFMAECMEPDGYLMHKYRVDGVLGSSWHPWMQGDMFKLPIQEDETASVIFMLNEHYAYAKDLEFIESLYNPFIEKCADFMEKYIDHETGLPLDSYDLWEEKYGSSTYTAASVYGGLSGAAALSVLLGKREHATRYREAAERIKQSILAYCYDVDSGTFIKSIRHEKEGKLSYDKTVDTSSVFGLVFFGVLDVFDKRVQSAFAHTIERLRVPGTFGGFMRYEGDRYYKTGEHNPPNAWCITTLWVARYYIRLAKNRVELEKALEILNWACDRATVSGILPEQIHPFTGEHLSTAPLVWSHAEFVITVDEYLKKAVTFR
jgi:glucoamylase